MHMADALISPAVGGTMWAATAGLTYYSARKLKANPDEQIVPLMGVLGAFIFAAQMINFTIPATGSSGPQDPHEGELAVVHFLLELPGAVDGEPGGGGPHRPAHRGGNQGIRHVHRHISTRCSLGALPPASERPGQLVRRNFPGDL